MGIWCSQGILRLTSGRSVGPHSVEKGCGPHCGPWGRAVRGIPIGFRLSWTPRDCVKRRRWISAARNTCRIKPVSSAFGRRRVRCKRRMQGKKGLNRKRGSIQYTDAIFGTGLHSGCTHLHVRHMQCDAQQASVQTAAMGASTTDHASGAAPNVLSADDDTTQRNESLQKCMRAP